MKFKDLEAIDNYLVNLDNREFLNYDLERVFSNKGLFYLKINPIYHNFYYDLEIIEDYLVLDLNLEKICITLRVFKLNKTSIREVLLIIRDLVKFYP